MSAVVDDADLAMCCLLCVVDVGRSLLVVDVDAAAVEVAVEIARYCCNCCLLRQHLSAFGKEARGALGIPVQATSMLKLWAPKTRFSKASNTPSTELAHSGGEPFLDH